MNGGGAREELKGEWGGGLGVLIKNLAAKWGASVFEDVVN